MQSSYVRVVLLVISYFMMTSLAMKSGKDVVMTDSSGIQVCSTDSPSQVLPMCPGGGGRGSMRNSLHDVFMSVLPVQVINTDTV
jgi:hypothetical protein